MIQNPFWKRIFRLGWLVVLSYAAVMYLVVFGMVLIRMDPLGYSEPKEAASRLLVPKGDVQASVRSVFGDRIPRATIELGQYRTQADEAGNFVIEGVPPGSYQMRVTAEGYQPLELLLQVEPGLNQPRIKHDTGLWPESFAVDFHVFTNNGKNGVSTLYGLIGLANGSNDEVFVRSILVIDPLGEILQDFLSEPGHYEKIVSSCEHVGVVTEPQWALVLPPWTVLELELHPVAGALDGTYALKVLVGGKKEHDLGTYESISVTDPAEEDQDWNPHIP